MRREVYSGNRAGYFKNAQPCPQSSLVRSQKWCQQPQTGSSASSISTIGPVNRAEEYQHNSFSLPWSKFSFWFFISHIIRAAQSYMHTYMLIHTAIFMNFISFLWSPVVFLLFFSLFFCKKISKLKVCKARTLNNKGTKNGSAAMWQKNLYLIPWFNFMEENTGSELRAQILADIMFAHLGCHPLIPWKLHVTINNLKELCILKSAFFTNLMLSLCLPTMCSLYSEELQSSHRHTAGKKNHQSFIKINGIDANEDYFNWDNSTMYM